MGKERRFVIRTRGRRVQSRGVRCFLGAAAAAALFLALDVSASDLVLFPALDVEHRAAGVPGQPRDEIEPALDVFYSGGGQRARLLAEYLAGKESDELERLQLGWRTAPDTTVWLGRFHAPLGYWTTEFHHSPYLQTSISHPSITFDDDAGPFFSHVTGALLEGTAYQSRSAIVFGAGAGAGPVMRDTLEPYDFFRPSSQHGRLAAAVRVGYRPQAEDQSEIGLSLGRALIPVVNHPETEIVQNLLETYVNYVAGPVRVIAEAYVARNALYDVTGTNESRFVSAYVHGDYRLGSPWTLFVRAENTFGAAGDPYLELLPGYIQRRVLAGGRYELTAHQALKFELSRNDRQDGIAYDELALQWCLVLP